MTKNKKGLACNHFPSNFLGRTHHGEANLSKQILKTPVFFFISRFYEMHGCGREAILLVFVFIQIKFQKMGATLIGQNLSAV